MYSLNKNIKIKILLFRYWRLSLYLFFVLLGIHPTLRDEMIFFCFERSLFVLLYTLRWTDNFHFHFHDFRNKFFENRNVHFWAKITGQTLLQMVPIFFTTNLESECYFCSRFYKGFLYLKWIHFCFCFNVLSCQRLQM